MWLMRGDHSVSTACNWVRGWTKVSAGSTQVCNWRGRGWLSDQWGDLSIRRGDVVLLLFENAEEISTSRCGRGRAEMQ